MRIQRFEEIKAWQEGRELVKIVYQIIRRNDELNRDLRFKSQLTSSSISIMSNIAEGFSRNSNKEFIRFLFISKGSLAELQSLLYVALDQKYITNEEFNDIFEKTEITAKLISKFITYLRSYIQ
ncbi:MAG: four helix bundle protein [Candidatus Omnitrophica bacterium]|nr:four helix bundle protein [Candidatus Omnitrophota bacterium]